LADGDSVFFLCFGTAGVILTKTPETGGWKMEEERNWNEVQPEKAERKPLIWKRIKRVLDGMFIGGIVLIFFVGLMQTLFFPDETSEYEKRYAEKVGEMSLSAWLDGSFQESMDNALGDQVSKQTHTWKALQVDPNCPRASV
jgi:hypothetical protein